VTVLSATRRRGGEEGMTLTEVVIASAIALVVVAVSSVAISTALSVSETANETGTTTGPALAAANAVEQVLTDAFIPAGVPATVTSDCTNGSAGTALSGSSNGPFVSAADTTSTTLYVCSTFPGTTTAYTYEVTFTSCSSSNVCTLAIERWAAPGCSSPCTAKVVEAFSGISDAATTPFSYYTDNPWGTTSTLSSIESVRVDLEAPTLHSHGTAAEVRRTVVLPNTLMGQS
jgi:hypothetical protein